MLTLVPHVIREKNSSVCICTIWVCICSDYQHGTSLHMKPYDALHCLSLQMDISLFCTNVGYKNLRIYSNNIACFNLISLYPSLPIFSHLSLDSSCTLCLSTEVAACRLWCCRLHNCCFGSPGLLCAEESYGAILCAIVQALLVNSSRRKRCPSLEIEDLRAPALTKFEQKNHHTVSSHIFVS